MLPAREQRDCDSSVRDNIPAPIILTTEALRGVPASSQYNSKATKAPEERISVFWRVFGGTLLSIAALVCITLFQQFTNGLSEVRTNLNRLNEGRGDLVKLDDFNTRMGAMWTSIKELQAASGAVPALKERLTSIELQIKTGQDQLSERLSVVANSLKEVETANAALSALKERSALLEQQLKTGEDERKELAREIQRLRERLAALEGRQNLGPPAKSNSKIDSILPRH
jgi:DNA repair exonuclease SbcCD ATPase subunit